MCRRSKTRQRFATSCRKLLLCGRSTLALSLSQTVLRTDRIYLDWGGRRVCQLLFERFNCHSYYVAESPIMSLYAANRTTGVCVDVGHGRLGALAPSCVDIG